MSREGKRVFATALGILFAFGVLWVAVRAFAVGWLSAREYEEVSRAERVHVWNEATREVTYPLSVDGKAIRRVGSRVLGGFIDQHLAYRVDCELAVFDRLVSEFGMSHRSDPALRRAFAETFSEAEVALERGAPIVTSPDFVHDGRGPDGDHYAALYDDATSTLYLWALHNF